MPSVLFLITVYVMLCSKWMYVIKIIFFQILDLCRQLCQKGNAVSWCFLPTKGTTWLSLERAPKQFRGTAYCYLYVFRTLYMYLSIHNCKMCGSRKYPYPHHEGNFTPPNLPGFSIFIGNWCPPTPSKIFTSVADCSLYTSQTVDCKTVDWLKPKILWQRCIIVINNITSFPSF